MQKFDLMSHPLRVRELKLLIPLLKVTLYKSHPLRVRELKLDEDVEAVKVVRSHPLRVRELKLESTCLVDEDGDVAPFTGA